MSKKIKLNKKQKMFLFENYYITSKMLDSLLYKGWENYWTDYFNWELDIEPDNYGWYAIEIIEKKSEIKLNGVLVEKTKFNFDLNFQDNDLETLLNLK